MIDQELANRGAGAIDHDLENRRIVLETIIVYLHLTHCRKTLIDALYHEQRGMRDCLDHSSIV